MHYIQQLINSLQSLIINIPLNNPLSVLYIIFNALIDLFALFSYGGSAGTGGTGTGTGL